MTPAMHDFPLDVRQRELTKTLEKRIQTLQALVAGVAASVALSRAGLKNAAAHTFSGVWVEVGFDDSRGFEERLAQTYEEALAEGCGWARDLVPVPPRMFPDPIPTSTNAAPTSAEELPF